VKLPDVGWNQRPAITLLEQLARERPASMEEMDEWFRINPDASIHKPISDARART